MDPADTTKSARNDSGDVMIDEVVPTDVNRLEP
jgi:hypothetical protein